MSGENILRPHSVRLRGRRMVLRPMTEDDWGLLHRWNNDAELQYWFDAEDVSSRSMEEVQRIYRGMSRRAFMFIGEMDGRPLAECWLQQMNLDYLLEQYPGLDLRRIDLGIGPKEWWGRGLGGEIIGLLTRFGFVDEGADMIFGPGIRQDNIRSLKAFAKNGYREVARRAGGPGAKSPYEIDMAVTKDAWGRGHGG